MATKNDIDLKQLNTEEKQLPPHIDATFKGTYYKTEGKDAATKEPFSIDVKIPMSWVESPAYTPEFIFANYYASRKLATKAGYQRTHSIYLASASGVSESLPLKQRLKWMTEFSEMVKEAQRIVIHFTPPDMQMDGTPLPQEEVKIRVELYPTVALLRDAIIRCIEEPLAFKREQEVRSKGRIVEQMAMEEQLRELGYE